MAAWPATAASPEFHLLDGDGHGRSLNDYRGHVVVVFFGFTHCPDFCPTELLKLQQSLKRIPGVRAKIQVLFVTLDPERDTPALLKQYVAAFDPTFVGLTGTPQNIAQAARNFGVEYARVAMGHDYTIDHSASIYLFDQNGKLRLIGSGATSNADFDHDLKLLAEESPSR